MKHVLPRLRRPTTPATPRCAPQLQLYRPPEWPSTSSFSSSSLRRSRGLSAEESGVGGAVRSPGLMPGSAPGASAGAPVRRAARCASLAASAAGGGSALGRSRSASRTPSATVFPAP